jgi:ZIP family zinc transporter
VLEALLIGGAVQSSLLLSGLLVYWVTVPTKVIGVLAGYGAGALIAAVAFDLLPEATDLEPFELSLWMLVGAGILLAGDAVVERRFGSEGTGGAMGIVVGSVVDGVPESIILGIQVAAGDPISASFVAAVLVSNIPQALAPSAELAEAGWPRARTVGLWAVVIAACAVAAVIGWAIAESFSGATGSRAAAIAAGGLLAMLTNSLMPFAYERGRSLAGVATVVGFCMAVGGT